MKWSFFLTVCSFVIFCTQFSCGGKSKEANIPKVDRVMLDATKPKLEKLNEVILNNPENPVNYFLRAKIYCEIGDYAKGLKDINQAILLDDSQAKFYFLLARINYQRKEKIPAIKAAEKAKNLGNKEAGLFILLGKLYMETGDFDKAQAYIARAAEIAPYHAAVFYLESLNMLHTGDTTNALAKLRKAVSKKPGFPEPYSLTALLYLKRNKPDSALFFVGQGFENTGNSAPLFFANGEIMENLGFKVASLASYENAAKADSSYLPVALRLGKYYFNKQDFSKAGRYLNRYFIADSGNQTVNLLFAEVLAKGGDDEKAISVYERVLRADASNPEAKKALELLYVAHGKQVPQSKEEAAKKTPLPSTNPVSTKSLKTVVEKPSKVSPKDTIKPGLETKTKKISRDTTKVVPNDTTEVGKPVKIPEKKDSGRSGKKPVPTESANQKNKMQLKKEPAAEATDSLNKIQDKPRRGRKKNKSQENND